MSVCEAWRGRIVAALTPEFQSTAQIEQATAVPRHSLLHLLRKLTEAGVAQRTTLARPEGVNGGRPPAGWRSSPGAR